MMPKKTLRIAVLPGDGIAHEIMPVCLALLADVTVSADSFQLTYDHLEAWAALAKTSSGNASPVRW